MPFFTYVLQSDTLNRNYYGSCHNLVERLSVHNKGKVKSTKAFKPWKIIYFEEFETRSEAYQRELFFKSSNGKLFLKEKGILSV